MGCVKKVWGSIAMNGRKYSDDCCGDSVSDSVIVVVVVVVVVSVQLVASSL